MRLKEPLYGLRMSRMHFLIHLCLAFTMIFLEVNLENLISGHEEKESSKNENYEKEKLPGVELLRTPKIFYERAYKHFYENEVKLMR